MTDVVEVEDILESLNTDDPSVGLFFTTKLDEDLLSSLLDASEHGMFVVSYSDEQVILRLFYRTIEIYLDNGPTEFSPSVWKAKYL